MKKLGIYLLSALIILIAGVLIVWNVVVPSFLGGISRSLILKKLRTIRNVKVEHLGTISINREFPSIVIKVSSIKLSIPQGTVWAKDISDRISVFKFLISRLLSQKPYAGSVRVKELTASLIIKTKRKSKDTPKIPTIPADIYINSTNVNVKTNKFTMHYRGTLSVSYNPMSGANTVTLSGKLNENEVEVTALTHREYASAEMKVSLQKPIYGVKTISGTLTAHLSGNLNLNVELNDVKYMMLHAKHVNITGNVTIKKKTIHMVNLNLVSSNGYNVNITGSIDLSLHKIHNLKGYITTPYIHINLKSINFPSVKTISRYLKYAEVKAQNIRFSGVFNQRFIKSGTIMVKKAEFRLKKNGVWMKSLDDTIEISEGRITAHVNGVLGKAKLQNSTIIIQRTKGYPCNMLLHFKGKIDKTVEAFLTNNIFPKKELAKLGNPRELKGEFKGYAEIRGYRWKPKPPFYFKVHIEANNLTLKNDEIPGQTLSVTGSIDTTRNTGKNPQTYVELKNFKATALRSSMITRYTRITIKPSLSFESTFSSTLARSDVSFIEELLLHKTPFTPSSSVSIKGSLRGNKHLVLFNVTAQTQYTTKGKTIPVNVKAKGIISPKIIQIANLEAAISGKHTLSASGVLNTKKDLYKCKLALTDFNLGIVSGLTPLPELSGLLNGQVNLLVLHGKIKNLKGNINLSGGNSRPFSLREISMNIKLNQQRIILENGIARSPSGIIHYDGDVILQKPYSLRFKLTSPVFTLETPTHSVKPSAKPSKHPPRTEQKGKRKPFNPSINIPNINTNILVHFGKFKFKHENKGFTLTDFRAKILKKGGSTKIIITSKESKAKIYLSQGHGSRIRGTITDTRVFPFITGSKMKDTSLSVNFRLRSRKTNNIDLKSLYGPIDAQAKNGEFVGVPPVYKVLAVTNIVSLLSGKVNFDKRLIYKKITAPLYLKNGILSTRKGEAVSFEGKSISIFAHGSYNIPIDYADFDVTFVTFRTINRLISSIPVVGWIIGGKEKSFTGLSFHVYGYLHGRMHAKPIPFKSVGKGILGVIKRTLTLPIHILK